MAYMIPMLFYEVPLGLWFLIKGVLWVRQPPHLCSNAGLQAANSAGRRPATPTFNP
jgi:hypothetical protein